MQIKHEACADAGRAILLGRSAPSAIVDPVIVRGVQRRVAVRKGCLRGHAAASAPRVSPPSASAQRRHVSSARATRSALAAAFA